MPRAHWPKACGILSSARGPKERCIHSAVHGLTTCGMVSWRVAPTHAVFRFFPVHGPEACGNYVFVCAWPSDVWHVLFGA